MCSYLPDVELPQKIKFSNCLPDFAQYPTLFFCCRSSHSRVLTLFWYFSYHATPFPVNNGSSLQSAPTGTDASSLALFLQLSSFTSISTAARFGTQLRSVLLWVSYWTLVFSLSLQLPLLSFHTQLYRLGIFPMNSILIIR
jgi:hypothetical protein